MDIRLNFGWQNVCVVNLFATFESIWVRLLQNTKTFCFAFKSHLNMLAILLVFSPEMPCSKTKTCSDSLVKCIFDACNGWDGLLYLFCIDFYSLSKWHCKHVSRITSEFSEWIHIWFYDCHLLANNGVNQDIPLGSCNQEKRNLPENVILGFIWIQKQCQRIGIFSQNAILKLCR